MRLSTSLSFAIFTAVLASRFPGVDAKDTHYYFHETDEGAIITTDMRHRNIVYAIKRNPSDGSENISYEMRKPNTHAKPKTHDAIYGISGLETIQIKDATKSMVDIHCLPSENDPYGPETVYRFGWMRNKYTCDFTGKLRCIKAGDQEILRESSLSHNRLAITDTSDKKEVDILLQVVALIKLRRRWNDVELITKWKRLTIFTEFMDTSAALMERIDMVQKNAERVKMLRKHPEVEGNNDNNSMDDVLQKRP